MMTQNPSPRDDASSSEDAELDVVQEIARLKEELAEYEALRDAREQEVRKLRSEEDFRGGRNLAQEIFSAQQDKLRLDVEVQMRRAKINRLKAGTAWQEQYDAITGGRSS